MLHLRRKTLVGLDIDASAVRMVQLRREQGRHMVVKTGVTEIASWNDDPQLRRLRTAQALVSTRTRYGLRGKFAVCGLRGPEVVVRSFEFPALPSEEIKGAVELEVSQICPFLAEDSTFDYQVTLSDNQRTLGFWVAATNRLIEDTRQLLSTAGWHCARIDVTGLALLNLLEHHCRREQQPPTPSDRVPPDSDSRQKPPFVGVRPPRDRPAVLNLGDACATVAVADPAGRPFVRDIGGNTHTNALCAQVEARGNIPDRFSAAEGGDEHREGRLEAARWPDTQDRWAESNASLVEDIATTLRYYAAQNSSVRLDRLLVCGGAAATEYVELLRQRLNLEVALWQPLAGKGFRRHDGASQSPVNNDPAWRDSSLAVAAGLALREI
jgi:type IV pilus assembly protein PilM